MLKRVKIQGYKSLADAEVHLQPLSVLFGPNAAGKSNFLDALQLLSRITTSINLKDAFEPPYRGTPLESFSFGENGIQGLLAQEKASFSIEVDVELSQAVIDSVNQQIQDLNEEEISSSVQEKYLRYRISIEIVPQTGVLYIKDEYLTALDSQGKRIKNKVFLQWDGTYRRMEGQKPGMPRGRIHNSYLSRSYNPVFHPHIVAMHEELASWHFYYLEPRERMRQPTPVKEVNRPGPMGEDLAAFLNTLHALDEPQFRAIEKTLHMLIPSITGIDVGVNNYGEVELRLIEGKLPVSARLISEGTLRILGLLALSSAQEYSSLLGFEEPENGVHPERIRMIASLLRSYVNNGMQIIVTTHSPTLLDLVPPESLYVCRQQGSNTSIQPFSMWKYPNIDIALNDEDEALPDLSISERVLRGDFDVED
jgi:predicted ATPase